MTPGLQHTPQGQLFVVEEAKYGKKKKPAMKANMGKLTETHLEELEREGFVVVPEYHTGDRLEILQATQKLP